MLEKTGGFREDLGRTEDNEFHYRVREMWIPVCYVTGHCFLSVYTAYPFKNVPAEVWKRLLGGPDPGSMSGLSVFVSSGAGGVCCRDRGDYPVMGASFSMACLDHVGPVWHSGCDHDGPFYQE